MTHQVMNRSFGKALAAATIAFMISSAASAQTQQDRAGRDRCFHSMRVRPAVRVPMVPPVYMYPVPNGGRPYPDYRRSERLSLTRQRSAGMAAEQEATRARLLQIRNSLANLLQRRRAQIAAQPPLAPPTYHGAIQGAPTMSPDAKASQEQASQLMGVGLFQKLLKAASPNDNSPRPKPICSPTSGSDCYSRLP
jgi:hypothetical protein